MLPTKKYEVKVVARPDPNNATAQPPQTNAKVLVNSKIRSLQHQKTTPLPLENAPVHASTPCPEAGQMSGSLFKLRIDWPIPPTSNTMTATNPKLPIKIEPQEPDQPTPSTIVPKPEQCRWGPNCPICKNAQEDWNGEHQSQFQQTNKNTQTQDTQQKNSFQTQNMRLIQAQNPQCTQDYQIPQNPQPTQTQSFNVPDRYVEQICLRKELEEKMERLNEKLGLHYFSDSELDSVSDKGENYQYEHRYDMLI